MKTTREIKAELAELGNKSRAYCEAINEGGEGYNPYDAKIEAKFAELKIAEDAEWTRDVTISRRAAWNKEVNTMTAPTAAKIAAKLGFEMETLKRYVTKYNI